MILTVGRCERPKGSEKVLLWPCFDCFLVLLLLPCQAVCQGCVKPCHPRISAQRRTRQLLHQVQEHGTIAGPPVHVGQGLPHLVMTGQADGAVTYWL